MKVFFKVLIVALLATATSLAKDARAATNKNIEMRNFVSAQAPNVRVDEASVQVALPTLADVFLKGGGSSSGRVTAIDSQGQNISIERGGRAANIPFSRIERVAFRYSAVAYRTDGRQILRGENQVTPVGSSQATWRGIPLNAFRLRDPSKGQADVGLASVVPRPQLRGIRAVARDRQYVVDEIRFDPQRRTMTIRATPY
jgi:hypothetical protein